MHDWELEALTLFMDMICSTDVRGVRSNKVYWKLAMIKSFEVQRFYRSLSLASLISFLWKMLWQLKVPPRVAFFSWFASLGKILTAGNL